MPGFMRPKFQPWPKDASVMSPADVIRMYENGFIGADDNPAEWEKFVDSLEIKTGEEVAHKYGYADSAAGKLVIPFVHVLELFPGCWPGPGQARGDCVSWDARNTSLTTMCGDISSGLPDEKTGVVEGPPDVPDEGIRNGVLSTETFYWHRGYDGDGWFCPASAATATTKSGLVVRKNYPEVNIDLTRYSGPLAGKYGRTPPPPSVVAIGANRLIHKTTTVRSFEVLRDLLYNRHGVSSCGGEGYQSSRDQYGVSKRSGSWAHALAMIGVDDRDVIKQIFNEPLVLINNSWSRWNSGPRDIYQSASLVPPEKKDLWIACGIVNPATGNIMIPEGSFWTPWSHCNRREMIAYAGAVGWQRKPLPDYGTHVWG